MRQIWLQSLTSWLFCLFGAGYSYWHFNGWHGIHIFLLAWSFYILLIPAGHGQLLIGYPLWRLTNRPWYPEPIIWLAAASLNIYTCHQMPALYHKTFLTSILYRILTHPYPYWAILLTALPGTLYYLLVHESYYHPQRKTHIFMRHLLIIGGVLFFCYATYSEFVILLLAKS